MVAAAPNKKQSDYIRSRPDRRRHFRVEQTLGGRFMLNETEYKLETINISCGSALIKADVLPPIGQSLVCYFDELGRVMVDVVRHVEDQFGVVFKVGAHKRDKLADRLIWLVNYASLDLEDSRESPRNTASGPALLTRADGTKLQCKISDISLTGAAFTHNGPPLLVGENVRAGSLTGQVIRSVAGEFAIRFTRAPKT